MEGHGQAVNNVARTLEITGIRLGADAIYHGWGVLLRFLSFPPDICGDRRSFRHFPQNCEKRLLASFFMLVRLSLYPFAWNNMSATGQIFMKFDI